jgi:hypothetical protein
MSADQRKLRGDNRQRGRPKLAERLEPQPLPQWPLLRAKPDSLRVLRARATRVRDACGLSRAEDSAARRALHRMHSLDDALGSIVEASARSRGHQLVPTEQRIPP